MAAFLSQLNLPPLTQDWKQMLCNCLDDKSMCVITFLAPCYQFSLNAEAMNHNCVACCIIYAVASCLCSYGCLGTYMRTLIRHKKNIQGTPLHDFLLHCCLPCLALIQEGQELDIESQEITRE